jgi:transposase
VAINLNKAYTNFFQGIAKFPRFKSKPDKQSIQYPQNVTVKNDLLCVPKIGEIKAVFHREITGIIKTVTISKTPVDQLPLDIREWDCPKCGTHHDQEFLDGTSPRIYPWNQSQIENRKSSSPRIYPWGRL